MDRCRRTRYTVVVDVGAGTGKLTRALTATGATVIAVERLAATHPELRGRGSMTLPYLTTVYWTERR